MAAVTTRAEFEKLIDVRMREAKLLLDDSDWDGSYYLGGYAVEFALKVCVISRLMKSNSYPERKDAERYYKHDLTDLRKLAGLDLAMDADGAVSPFWDTVKDWSEQTRYTISKTEKESRISTTRFIMRCCRGSRHDGRQPNC